MSDLALLVVSCDSYTNIAHTFFELQERFMGWFDGPKYFVNETKPFECDNVTTIHVGPDKDWSAKVLSALEYIPEKYVLFMLEDYFIGKPVAEKTFKEAFQTLKEHSLKYYRITNIPKGKGKSKIAPYLSDIQSNMRYGINLQAAFFLKDFLMEICSGVDRSAWAVETDLLKNVTSRYEYDLKDCVVDRRNIIDIHNGVIKGRWVKKTVAYFKKQGFNIDLGDRELLPGRTLLWFKIKSWVANVLPPSFVRKIKKVLRKIGFRFVSNN